MRLSAVISLGMLAGAVLCTNLAPCSSPPDTLWTRSWGIPGQEIGYSIHPTPDDGFVATGTRSWSTGRALSLSRLGSSGEVSWSRECCRANMWTGGYAVDLTHDGGYVITGSNRPNPGNEGALSANNGETVSAGIQQTMRSTMRVRRCGDPTIPSVTRGRPRWPIAVAIRLHL